MTLLEAIATKTSRYSPTPFPWDLSPHANVLDFGGAFGVHYLQAKTLYPNLRWAIVETPDLVDLTEGCFTTFRTQTSRFIDHGPGKASLLARALDHRKVHQRLTILPKSTFQSILSSYNILNPFLDTYICDRKG